MGSFAFLLGLVFTWPRDQPRRAPYAIHPPSKQVRPQEENCFFFHKSLADIVKHRPPSPRASKRRAPLAPRAAVGSKRQPSRAPASGRQAPSSSRCRPRRSPSHFVVVGCRCRNIRPAPLPSLDRSAARVRSGRRGRVGGGPGAPPPGGGGGGGGGGRGGGGPRARAAAGDEPPPYRMGESWVSTARQPSSWWETR